MIGLTAPSTVWDAVQKLCGIHHQGVAKAHLDRNEREEVGGGVGVGVHVYVRGRSVLSFWLVA